MTKIIEVDSVYKSYFSGANKLTVLHDVSFAITSGKTYAIVGPSGSGKTTLLGICAGLDTVDSGSVRLGGTDLRALNEDQRALLRNNKVGFIFQDFQLLPTLTALENVAVPLELQGVKNAVKQVTPLLEKVGLKDRLHHYPSQLSGGEKQRVAIARAFANNPQILFADEPTGNLDTETGTIIEDLLFELNSEAGTTLVIVTHDMGLAQKTNEIIRINAGRIVA